jgi:phage shock protein C
MFQKLYRSPDNHALTGLCGGLGEYFNVDPKLFRWFFIIFALCGIGIFAYVVGFIMFPLRSSQP